jgi:hypothetical protein
MKKLVLFLLVLACPVFAAPPRWIIIGDSTMVLSCRVPGWLPKGAECRAIGGQSFQGYLTQLQQGPCDHTDIVVGSIGLNAGLKFRPFEEVQDEFAAFISAVRMQCPGSQIVLIGINENKIMPEMTRELFNGYASMLGDRYIEPPFGIDMVPDGVHYTPKASWMLRPLIFLEDD